MIQLPTGLDPASSDGQAFRAGVAAAEDCWRDYCISLLTHIAGGERGLAVCRVDGKCDREPQLSLELAMEKLFVFQCEKDQALPRETPPATALLALLAHLARTPKFTPIHIKRDELHLLLEGIRKLQSHARSAVESIDNIGPLTYDRIGKSDQGTLLTSLSGIRHELRELLK